jgi:hypothetical protein
MMHLMHAQVMHLYLSRPSRVWVATYLNCIIGKSNEFHVAIQCHAALINCILPDFRFIIIFGLHPLSYNKLIVYNFPIVHISATLIINNFVLKNRCCATKDIFTHHGTLLYMTEPMINVKLSATKM